MAAWRAVRLVFDNLVGAYREPANRMFRENMMMASLMAGLAFSNASLGLVHAMAHSLGGAKELNHGECNALLLEKVVRFNFTAAADKYIQLAGAMGLGTSDQEPEKTAAAIVDRIASLRSSLEITQRLQDMGVASTELPQLAGFAFRDPCLATNPRQARLDEIASIYREIY
jgi:alcohol dehydrogenase class IV